MSIPLVQKAEKDDINTSIIAIKRNIERINMLLGLSNSEEIDTSEFVKKSDIVDEVTVNNMQSVTSNAVAKALAGKAPKSAGVSLHYLTPRQLNTASSFTSWVEGLENQGTRFAIFSVGWEEYQSFPYAGAIGYVMIGNSSAHGYGQLRNYGDANFTRAFYWTDSIATNRYSGIVGI
jgi:hypothetical protein